ncbi:hypothetical protein [Methylobacterium persicinum]|uniref:Uncharacterized protein n=1 Tax=Methylobacterium persicinum TaxID=374426 RepID=A0ABU0HHG3_9HYPH|nr:hypothetical protein [Methylobacterium persicinum]MDQ0441756.1 hypothetical protein [Methylobacterium persicinum]GJE39822.1 hypothetical protein KHHGKMAE_3908 [Methylobacterium persicinum]
MATERKRLHDLRAIEDLLAGAAVSRALVRLRREDLGRKYSASQPRAPAGSPDGGRWIDDPSADRATSGSTDPQNRDAGPFANTESTTLEDGTRVLSIRIHAGRQQFEEQHAVISPDGDSRIFETSGTTQTIRDGVSGEVLSQSTFTASDIVPDATVQPAFLQFVPPAVAALRAARTIELALSLFTALSARKGDFGTVLGLTAREYDLGAESSPTLVPWVGTLDKPTLDAACPRNGEVMAMTDRVTKAVRASGQYRNKTELGNKIHINIAGEVKALRDPDFIQELLLDPTGDKANPQKRETFALTSSRMSNLRKPCVFMTTKQAKQAYR